MTARCPYCHVSYASWRLKAFHLLAVEVTASLPAQRSFMTSSGCQFPKPNPNQKKRRGNTRRQRIQELSKLETLRTELSVLAEELKSKPQATQSPGASIPSERENSISNLSRQPEDIPETHTRFSNFLPKSPIVTRLEQRAQKLKQRANEQDIDRLKYNPWAQLLASPVRMCAATGARVPEKLLGSWGLVQHPETQNLWLMPVDLVKEELQRVSLKSVPAASESFDDVFEVDPGLPSPPPRSSFPSFYMTNDEELLGAISKMKWSQPGRLISNNWKVPKGPLPRKMPYVFRKDMPEFFLARLRERVFAWLKKAKRLRPLGEISGCWTVLDTRTDIIGEEGLGESLRKLGGLEHAAWGAVLILRRAGGVNGLKSSSGEGSVVGEDIPKIPSTSIAGPTDESMFPNSSNVLGVHSESGQTSPELPRYIALPATGSLVPVFDLTTLLTKEQVETLRHHADIFQHPAVFYRPGQRATVSIISWLWKLKIYMMDRS
ncbi:conserved hypothetical protein [Histoplasma capsulatum H143]|uniref:Uncharacterized protein n=1 Tax=Ajellomyces capsulatus (strain H143) TaxID=544712 RepID=C6H4K0_AJECH|nr:conserved hypothetical protein [Histoplasma capsulatum H143]